MNVDRIARAMTAGGPKPTFKARVMAPIHGRPSPDFTQRVMNGIDLGAAQPLRPRVGVAQPFRAGVGVAQAFRPRVVLVPATIAIAIAVGAVMLRDSRETIVPAAPTPPPQTARTVAPQSSPVPKSRTRKVTKSPQPEPAVPAHPAIYTIAALESMPDIEMKSIEPAACTIPALTGPAPLKVTDLPGAPGGSRHPEFKERP